MPRNTPTRRGFGLAAAFFVATAAAGCMHLATAAPAAASDYATQRLTALGLYRTSFTVEGGGAVPVGRLHSWKLHIERPDGSPVTDAAVTVDGDMPQHLHGLPSRPQVTRHLGNGDYLVEGIKFQMGGWWVMDFTIASGARKDVVRFNLQLQK